MKRKIYLLAFVVLVTIFASQLFEKKLFILRERDQKKVVNDTRLLSTRSYNRTDLLVLEHITFNSVEIDRDSFFTVLVLISSNSRNVERRNWIRNTWGNSTKWKTKAKWKVVFICGEELGGDVVKGLRVEAEKHKDIILEGVRESFYLLAKKVIIGMTWAMHFTDFGHILKGDDDVFINIDNIVKFIERAEHKDGYFGQVMIGQPVERKGRYKLTKKEHPNDRFAPYCSGGGFIVSKHTVYKTLPLLDFNNILRIDDAYFGSFVGKAGFSPQQPSGFYMWNNGCEYRSDVMVSHPAKQLKCLNFLMKKSMIDGGMLARDAAFEKQKYAYPPPSKT